MGDRGGCVSGSRGFGARKFNGVLYEVYEVYVMSQNYGMDRDIFEKLKAENTALMEKDASLLKERGYKIRILHKECETIHVLYYVMQSEIKR